MKSTNLCISNGPTYATPSFITAKHPVNVTSFQKQRINVVLTGCLDFSSGLGQFFSKISDSFSARCSGESVGISSIISGVLYPFFNKGFSHNQNVFDKMEADAHPLTFDDLFNSSGFDSGVTLMPVEPVTDTITKKAEKGSEMDEIKSLDFDNGVLEIRRVILEEAISAIATKFTTQNTRREIG